MSLFNAGEFLHGYVSMAGEDNTETQAMLIRYEFEFPDGNKLSFDFLRFYKMVSMSFVSHDLDFLFSDKVNRIEPLQKG